MWSSNQISNKVIRSADRFGPSNTQQLKQLNFSLSKCEPQEVFDGLIQIFTNAHPNFVARQSLAGYLLFEIKPQANFDIKNTLIKILPFYELSVEELPYYLVSQLSLEIVKEEVNNIEIEQLSNKEKRALDTINYWLRNYEQFSKKNG